MKLALIVSFLIVGAASAQLSIINNCVADFKADIFLMQKIVADYRAGEKVQVLEDVAQGKELLDKTKIDCKGIRIKDMLNYMYTALTQEQQICITQVYATILIAIEVAADIKGREWSLASKDSQRLLSSVNVAMNVCTPATLARLLRLAK